jgi:hypothetical protein
LTLSSRLLKLYDIMSNKATSLTFADVAHGANNGSISIEDCITGPYKDVAKIRLLTECPGDDDNHPNHRNNNPMFPFVRDVDAKLRARPEPFNSAISEYARDLVIKRLQLRLQNNGRLPRSGTRSGKCMDEISVQEKALNDHRLFVPQKTHDNSLSLVDERTATKQLDDDADESRRGLLFHTFNKETKQWGPGKLWKTAKESVELALAEGNPTKLTDKDLQEIVNNQAIHYHAPSFSAFQFMRIGPQTEDQDRFFVELRVVENDQSKFGYLYMADPGCRHPDNPLYGTKPPAQVRGPGTPIHQVRNHNDFSTPVQGPRPFGPPQSTAPKSAGGRQLFGSPTGPKLTGIATPNGCGGMTPIQKFALGMQEADARDQALLAKSMDIDDKEQEILRHHQETLRQHQKTLKTVVDSRAEARAEINQQMSTRKRNYERTLDLLEQEQGVQPPSAKKARTGLLSSAKKYFTGSD